VDYHFALPTSTLAHVKCVTIFMCYVWGVCAQIVTTSDQSGEANYGVTERQRDCAKSGDVSDHENERQATVEEASIIFEHIYDTQI